MRHLSLLDGKITLALDAESGTVDDTLQELCPFCRDKQCIFNCDQSQSDDLVEGGQASESADEVYQRIQYNAAIEGITAFVLAQACAGIDVEDAKYQETLQGALDSAGHYYM